MLKKMVVGLMVVTGVSYAASSIKQEEQRFINSIISASKKVRENYSKRITLAKKSKDSELVERLTINLTAHKKRVANLIESAKYNPRSGSTSKKPLPKGLNDLHLSVELPPTTVIKFTDRNFESFVRELLFINKGNSAITIGDVKGVTELVIPPDSELAKSKRIKDISEIKYFTSLELLSIPEQAISSLKPLNGLKNLKEIEASKNRLVELELSDLPSLHTLDVQDNTIKKIINFKNLPQLSKLNLLNNKITDITTLKKLPRLQHLEAGRNKFSDLSPLNSCTKLTTLDLREPGTISFKGDMEALCKSLKILYILDAKLIGREVLAKFTNLEELMLCECNLKSIDFLKNHKKLWYLNVSDNRLNKLDIFKTLYDNGCFQNKEGGNCIEIQLNGFELSAPNRHQEVYDELIKNGVKINWEQGRNE